MQLRLYKMNESGVDTFDLVTSNSSSWLSNVTQVTALLSTDTEVGNSTTLSPYDDVTTGGTTLLTSTGVSTSTAPTTATTPHLFYYSMNSSYELNITQGNWTGLQPHLAHHPALAIVLSIFAFITIFGNSLVIIAVIKERYLRSATNHMIVSLAIADLVVGTIVMPFSIIQTMMGGYWYFGNDWCDLWHSFDVLSATGSILNLCVIALDRYWAITDPIAYPTRMSNKRVWILISLVWLCSSAISFPAILWWRADQPEFYPPNECLFTESSSYLIISSIVSFYTPLFIMLFVYYRIYRAATARNRSLKNDGKIVLKSDGLRGEVLTLRIHRGRPTNPSMIRNGHDYQRPLTHDTTDTETGTPLTHTDSEDADPRPHTRCIKRRIQKFGIGRKLSRLAKEQKAAKTLGIVMGIFILCWCPFFLTNVLMGICGKCVVHADIMMPIFTWLGYLNSGMNPIIYSLSMRDFKRAFRSILCAYCPKVKLKPHQPARSYQRSMSTTSFNTVNSFTPVATGSSGL